MDGYNNQCKGECKVKAAARVLQYQVKVRLRLLIGQLILRYQYRYCHLI